MGSLNTYEFVTAYADGGNSFYGTARFGKAVGGIPVYGPPAVFNAGNTAYISIIKLSVGKIVVAYRDSSDANKGKAVLGDISGDTITFGSEYEFNDGATNHISGDRVASDKFVITYQDGGDSNQGTAIVGTVSGTTITFGGEYDFNAAATGDLAMTAFPWQTNQFVIAFRDNDDLNKGKAIHGTVGGNGYYITYGSEYTFNGDCANITIDWLNIHTKFVVAYQDRENSNFGAARIGETGGSVISFGDEVTFNSASTSLARNLGVAWFGTDTFILGYENILDNDGRSLVGTVSSKTITLESPVSFNSGSNSAAPVVTRLSPDMYVVAWADESDSNHGKVRVYGGDVIFLPIVIR
jgi:hypothetical protein